MVVREGQSGRRPLPAWFDEAKFGIFIHWGLFSIPAFAPKLGKISDVFKTHYHRAVTLTPYTEWYANAIRVPGTPSAEFHQAHYPGMAYADFREPFLNGLKRWDPEGWAALFAAAGARYVVLVSKHHDGYCLWPSRVRHPHHAGWATERDVVGELARAVRDRGMRFGLYYSGGIDWSFNPRPLKTFGDFIASAPGGAYPRYAAAQFRELIERYEPSVLWNDISWPDDRQSLEDLLAFYYARVGHGVVNDRWQHTTLWSRVLKWAPARRAFDFAARRHIEKHPESVDGVIPRPIPQSDFRTPEYAAFKAIQDKKWEATRGMSHSFGFNRNDTEEDYESAESLLFGLIDAVSKNGNLLLNVGPRGKDAAIPGAQRRRLEQMGAWLGSNGEAIYGTRPWRVAESVTDQNLPVRYTCKDGRLYVIFPGTPSGRELRVRNFPSPPAPDPRARHLASGMGLEARVAGADLTLRFPRPLPDAPAHVVVIRHPASDGPA